MGRLSNTDGQIYIDKPVMVDKREGMTDMERQKDGKQVFDQRPEGFFTRMSRSSEWRHMCGLTADQLYRYQFKHISITRHPWSAFVMLVKVSCTKNQAIMVECVVL